MALKRNNKTKANNLGSARQLGHDLGYQILVDEPGPSQYSITGGTSAPMVLNSLDEVVQQLEEIRKEAVVYDDGFVVVYKHPVFALTALNSGKGGCNELWNSIDAAEWSLYAHDDGAMLQNGIDSSPWILTGDVGGLLIAGVVDRRMQWAALHAKLDAAIEVGGLPIPYVANTDAYTIKYGLSKYVSSKWPRQDFGVDYIKIPVMQATIAQHHKHKDEWQHDGSADLALAVAWSLNINWEPGTSIDDIFALVEKRLKNHKVKTIILRDPQFLGYGHNHESMLVSLIERAQTWGCKVVLVGSLEFCWEFRSETNKIEFDLIIPESSSIFEPLFFQELRQFVRRSGYGVDLDLTPEIGALVWEASGHDRERAIALCRAMVFVSNGAEENKMDKSVLEMITKSTPLQ